MKVNTKTVIGLFMATILLFFGTYSIKYYLKTSANKMLAKVVKIEANLNTFDFKSAKDEAIELNQEWIRLEKKWTIFTNHHEIDNITTSLKNTIEFITFKDIPNSMANLEALRHYIEHIPNMEELNLKNIL